MTSRRLAVLMFGRRCGTLAQDRNGRLTFTYDDEYRTDDDATPLSTSMPTQIAEHTGSVVSAFLSGLLPDNADVLRRWGRRFHVSHNNPFALLGTPVGKDCAGAVQFVDESEVPGTVAGEGDIAWLSDHDIGERLRQLQEDRTAWLPSSEHGHFSLAGAQAKTALLLRDGRWGLPSGSVPSSHILKPAIQGFDGQDINEHLCLEAARRVDLTAALSQVMRFEDETAIVVRRYDRRTLDGRLSRIHQEDLCQAFGIPPSDKYQNEGGPGPAEISGLLRERIHPRDKAEEAVARFTDALLFNWLIGGTDAHAKNYSLLLSGPQVRLAPLYDLTSALTYYDEKALRLAMKFGGEYRLKAIWPSHIPDVAAACGVDGDRLTARARDLADQLPDAFVDAVRDDNIRELDSPIPVRLLDAVADRCRRILGLMDGDAAGGARG